MKGKGVGQIPSPSGLTEVGKSVLTSMSTNQQAPSPSGRGLEPAPYHDTGVRVNTYACQQGESLPRTPIRG